MIFQWFEKLKAAAGLPGSSLDLFQRLCRSYEERLRRWPWPAPAPEGAPRAAVLITPWLSTAVPLFNLECAAMLQRAGHQVTLILDFTDVIGNSPAPAHEEALRRLCSGLGVRLVSPDAAQPAPGDEEHARRIADLNAVRVTWGESTAPQFFADHPHAVERLREHLGRVRGLLARERFDTLLLPGGVYGLSALYSTAAGELGLPFTTYDCGTGSLRLCQNGIAAHLADIPSVQERLEAESTPAELAAARAIAQDELDLRLVGMDSRQFQLATATGNSTQAADVLVPLNVIWDSAALGRQHVFRSCHEWLVAILEWAATRPEVSVCIRQHPRERVLPWKTQDDPGATVAQYAHLGPRIRFIAATDPVSTYDLLKGAKVVLPHTSTVGVEAAVYGRPVVLSTRCYYDGLGFCQKPENAEEYFRAIDEALSGHHIPNADQRARAAFNYYLTQRCSWLRTDFTGVPEDFEKWVTRSPDELAGDPALADFRTALTTGENLPIVRHRRFRQEAVAQASL